MYKGYTVRTDGCIYSPTGRTLYPTTRPDGYLVVTIDGVLERVHRVIAKTFLPNPEYKRTVNHKDGNKLNNNLSNLEWATHSENTKHAYDIGLNWAPAGSANVNSKLTPSQVEFIRCSAKERYYGWAKDMCIQFNISRTNLYKCINGESYEETDPGRGKDS